MQALVARAASGTWDAFSSRVTVRRQWVTSAGEPTRLAPVVSEYVFERERRGRGWHTRITVAAGAGPRVESRQGAAPLAEPGFIARIEDAEDGTLPRVFNRAGEEMLPRGSSAWRRLAGRAGADVPSGSVAEGSATEPHGSVVAALMPRAIAAVVPRGAEGTEWVQSLLMPAGGARARLQSITTSFGRRTSSVGGLGRYVRDEGQRRVEWLVDEQAGVPVEVNVADGEGLLSHTRFRYDRAVDGALLRRGVRSERRLGAVGDSPGDRLVTDITYGQIRLGAKGGR